MKKLLKLTLLGLVAGLLLAGCGTDGGSAVSIFNFGGKSGKTASGSYDAYEIVDSQNVPVTLKKAINGDNSVKSIKTEKLVTKDKTQINKSRVVIAPKDDFGWAKVLGIILIIMGVGSFGASIAKKVVGSFSGLIGKVVGFFAVGWKTSLAIIIAGGALYIMKWLLLVVALFGAVILAVEAIRKDFKDDGKLNGSFLMSQAAKIVSDAKETASSVVDKVTGSTTDTSSSTASTDTTQSS